MRVTIEDASGGRVVIDGDEAVKDTPEREPWDGTTIAGRLLKAQEERRFTLCVAYPANRADRAVAADSHTDFAGPQAVEDAAHAYLLKHRKIGRGHLDGTDGAGDLVESGIYRGPDWPITFPDGSQYVVKAGDWLIGVVWPQDIWDNEIRPGRSRGVSMQGSAVRRRPDPSSLAQLRD